MENVFPEPVCPYAKMVPLKPLKALSSVGTPMASQSCVCFDSRSYIMSNPNRCTSPVAGDLRHALPSSIVKIDDSPASRLFRGRHRTATRMF